MALYFVALLPPPQLEEQIRGFKLEIKQLFCAKNSLRLPAHITLQIPFRMREEQEPVLEEALTAVALSEAPLEVQLDGFDSFPPRVIFIKFVGHPPLIRLHRKLSRELYKIISGLKEDREMHPHISIASRDLEKENFRAAWKEFRGKEYKAAFLADSYFLFRHNGQSWDIFRKFGFGELGKADLIGH